MIKILFFDFDGTISDAKDLVYKTFTKVLEKHNYKFDKQKVHKLLGAKIAEILKELGIPKNQIIKTKKEHYKKLLEEFKKNKLKLCVSVEPLKELRKRYKMIVISNSESPFIRVSAEKLKVANLFHEFYPAEKFTTKDEELKRLFKKYKIKPHEAVYIGDRFSDVRYARKSGCWAISIHNKCSWSPLKDVLKEKPDFIIKDFYGLKKVLEKLNSQLI